MISMTGSFESFSCRIILIGHVGKSLLLGQLECMPFRTLTALSSLCLILKHSRLKTNKYVDI